jgi:plasmid stabilization system protein ParE
VAYKILFTEDALVDLEIILDYVCADNPRAAERFGASLLNYIFLTTSNYSKAFPESAPGYPVGPAFVRFFTPVRIYYRLHEDRTLIEILHLWHGARKDPPSASQ